MPYAYAYAIELLALDGFSSTEEDCAAFLERGKNEAFFFGVFRRFEGRDTRRKTSQQK